MGNQQTVNGSGDPQGRSGGGGSGGGYGGYGGNPPQQPPGYGGGAPYEAGGQQQHPYPLPSQHQQQQQQQTVPDGIQQQQLPPDFQRSSSDASMTIMDSNVAGSQQPPALGLSGSGGIEDWLDDDTVPTVFRWEHGGRHVYITGTFNGWSRQIPMHRSGNDFTYIHNLKRGKHAFKFIVDDEWRFAPDQPTVADIEGRINNFIDVTTFKAYTGDKEFEHEKAAAEYGVLDGALDEPTEEGGPDKDGEIFSHNTPDVYDYTKEPPPLPPHLRHIILNKPPQLQDTAALPVPQHVALNHLYCTAIRDNMMVLGITQRYKTKFVTTVYYSPCSSK